MGLDVFLKNSFARQNGSLRAEGFKKRKKIYPKSHLKYRSVLSTSVNECNSTNEKEQQQYKLEEDLSLTN